MKKKILATAALACLLAYAPQPARADMASDAITKFASFVSNSPNAATKGCQKANFASGVFSVRSFEGNFCSHPVVAAWALKTCPAASDDFGQSKCRAIAIKTLDRVKEKDSSLAGSENPDLALAQQVSKLTSSLKATLCAKASNGGGPLSKACSTSPAALKEISAPKAPPAPPAPAMSNSNSTSTSASGTKAKSLGDLKLTPEQLQDARKNLKSVN